MVHIQHLRITTPMLNHDLLWYSLAMNRKLDTTINRSELAAASVGTNLYGYSYDTIGNRLWAAANLATNTYAANSLNQYTSVGRGVLDPPQTTFVYDADGNMTRDDRFLYSYDAENRLRSVTALPATNGALRVLNAYDHSNRRIRKTVQRLYSTIAPPPSPPVGIHEWDTQETHTFVWDGNNIVLEKVEFAALQALCGKDGHLFKLYASKVKP